MHLFLSLIYFSNNILGWPKWKRLFEQFVNGKCLSNYTPQPQPFSLIQKVLSHIQKLKKKIIFDKLKIRKANYVGEGNI